MDFINGLMTQHFGAMGPFVLIGGLGLVLILATIPMMLNQRKDPLEKLRESAASGRNAGTPGKALRTAKGNDKLQKYSTFLEPQNEEEYSAVRKKLMQAGYRSKEAVRAFHFAQFALGILFLLGGVIYYMLNMAGLPETTTQDTMIYILGPGIVGYMLPKYWVTKRQQQRQEEITSGFPDALDMMLVCVEAGQSLDQSIIRVARELRASYPSLSDEFEIVSYEIKAGKDKPSVLADMGERCGVADISSFVTVLVQSASFGTSIADALRVYAEEMRDKRVMRAEEKANKLPTKMTLVTMMLTVPPLLIILVGPSVLGIQNLGNM
ncbi:MAG: type II secretion system F family protein [Paracoccaceae bacterium]|jgi:tight adherence protein C